MLASNADSTVSMEPVRRQRTELPHNMRDFLPDQTMIRHRCPGTQDTWIGLYDSATNKIRCAAVSYPSPSTFAEEHKKLIHPERERVAANGWDECEACVNGMWTKLKVLRENRSVN